MNGVSLAIGLVIGTQLTGNKLEKTIKKMMKESKMLQNVESILYRLDIILSDKELTTEIVGFFKDAKALVTSPEAINFFKNATLALKEFTEEDKSAELKLPSKEEVEK